MHAIIKSPSCAYVCEYGRSDMVGIEVVSWDAVGWDENETTKYVLWTTLEWGIGSWTGPVQLVAKLRYRNEKSASDNSYPGFNFVNLSLGGQCAVMRV